VIVDHINSYNPQISHYRREHAPRRRYLPPEITLKSMFADFMIKQPKFCTYDKYRKVVQKMNISFARLGVEECEFCVMHANHSALCENAQSCDVCQKHVEHKQLAGKIRQLYTEDKNKPVSADHSFRSVDLQKVLMLPCLPGMKSAVFTRRLVVFHETFAPLKTLENTIAVLWHEGIAGRSASDIASTFITAMKQEPNVEHFTFWMDNCSAQNKNWTIFSAMVSHVNSNSSNPQSVTFKFLLAGHTFMSADAFHAKVEKEIRLKRNLCDFGDLQDAVTKANKNVKVVSMDSGDFHKWESGAYSARKSGRPLLSSIHQVRFVKGSKCMHYTLHPGGTESTYDFLTKKFKLSEPQSKTVRGIPSEKKNEIIAKLCPLMSDQTKTHFWTGLPISAVPDLIDHDDDDVRN